MHEILCLSSVQDQRLFAGFMKMSTVFRFRGSNISGFVVTGGLGGGDPPLSAGRSGGEFCGLGPFRSGAAVGFEGVCPEREVEFEAEAEVEDEYRSFAAVGLDAADCGMSFFFSGGR
jgi:hypothetical protein